MKAGNLLKLAGTTYVNNQSEHLRPGVIDTLTIVNNVAETFNAELAATIADTNLSPQGRVTGGKRVAMSALARLNALETTTIKNLNDRAITLERTLLGKASFTPPTDPAERISHELRMQEIRSQLRELPASQRLSVYLTTSDPLTLAAIETAPPTLSAKRPDGSRRLEDFIDPAERSAAVLERAKRADPETVKTLDEVRSLREVYQLAVNGVRKEILDEVPTATPESEPVVA